MNIGVSILLPENERFGDNLQNLHDKATRAILAQRVARLCGGRVADTCEISHPHAFFIPADTLTLHAAAELGIIAEDQLFGGAVPMPFVGTKIVSHGLWDENAQHPSGWAQSLGPSLGDAVLRGYSVFSPDDARIAGRMLLEHGPVRLKDVKATSGRGQFVVHDSGTLDLAVDSLDPSTLKRTGLVLEENLEAVETYSVGTVSLLGCSIAYWGTQNLTHDNHGAQVYGGSHLRCTRGGWGELLGPSQIAAPAEIIAKARNFDAAVFAAYPDIMASRRNYDVASGSDAQGLRKTGVLEQSWRVGGASGAEIAAFEAFAADPELEVVETATVEVYGGAAVPPPGATIYFSGVDPTVGRLDKYTERR